MKNFPCKLKKEPYIHIVSFDIPYPPDYGGIIDVFYKIKYLHQAGIKIILHCFQYNNKPASEELEKYCHKVYYYKRNTSLKKQFSLLPYTLSSRIDSTLLNNLLKDDYPILFETLHTAYYIQHPLLKNRKKILRLSNIEHHYYYHLFLAEKNLIRKIYFLIESIKLYFYEKRAFQHANIIVPVTQNDNDYVHKYYPKVQTCLIPSFHSYNSISVWKGSGKYLLYHANLSVPENYAAAEYLIKNIAGKISIPVIITGKNPPKHLYQKAEKYKHIQIVANPDEEEMKHLIQNAHIVWLYTQQATGLKLKLIHSLYTARFIICNHKIIAGTSLCPNLSLHIKNTSSEIINTIEKLKSFEFDENAISQRQELLKEFNNSKHLKQLISIIADS